MLRNYVTVAFRNILRHKGHSLINVAGLALGMACCLLISLYVRFELSYDDYHADKDRIFRVAEFERAPDNDGSVSVRTGGPVGPALKQKFPQVESYARVLDIGPGLVRHGNDGLVEERRSFADADLFRILTIPFLRGDPHTALTRPGTVVISERVARKLFGGNNPVGETILVGSKSEYEITGVVANPRRNAHLKSDIILSLKTLEGRYPFEEWFLTNFYTYVKLAPRADTAEFSRQMDTELGKEVGGLLQKGDSVSFFLQPVSSIHLHSHGIGEREEPGNPVTVAAFSAISLLILVVACMNFVNLTTAGASGRSREVGVRKVVGAGRRQIAAQFLCETFLLTLLASLAALVITRLFLPLFNSLSGMSFAGRDLFNGKALVAFLGGVCLVSLAAGGYPAWVFSTFSSVAVLKGEGSRGRHGALLRRTLVTVQFVVSIVLLAGTLIISSQVSFMKSRPLGFEKERTLVLPIPGSWDERYEEIKHEFLKNPAILQATASSNVPGRGAISRWTTSLAGVADNASPAMDYYYVDADFLQAYDIQIVAGRAFQRTMSTDMEDSYIINETAVRTLGWASPQEAIGKRIVGGFEGSERTIVGVIRDFHYRGLQLPVEPMVLQWRPSMFEILSLRLRAGSIDQAMAFEGKKFAEIFPGIPHEYHFLDEDFDRQYRTEERLGRLFVTFTFLGLFIACLGLLGLASSVASQRTKEIGIRKVLGAQVWQVVLMFSRELTQWALVANLIAWPVAYVLMNRWLQSFACRISIGIGPFLLSGATALILALLTVGYQSMKAGLSNPTDSLRYE